MCQFKLVEPCEIDGDALDGLTPQHCFVLGVEWEAFYRKLRSGKPFVDLVHQRNAIRLVRMAERRRRFVEHSPHPTPGWTKIVVGGTIE
jgi:hypothetical protein